MQAPPPVANLLLQLETMAAQINCHLRTPGLDWAWRPADEHWSLTEIMSHLRDVELEVHQARFRLVMESPNAFIAGVAADEWAAERNYQTNDGPVVREAYLAARRETVEMLRQLPDSAWSRQGEHAFLGPTSLHELLHLVTRHDELHWEQIKEILRAQGTEADEPPAALALNREAAPAD
jgi:hypothetical protein